MSSKKISWPQLLLPWEIARDLLRHKELMRQFTKRDLLARYRGSFLGVFWSLLRPLSMLAVFTVVFGYIFESKLGHNPNETRADFALALFCGLILFEFASQCISRSPTLMLVNSNYVTKVVFPLEVLPVCIIGSALIQLAISLIPLFAGMVLARGAIPVTVLYLPLLAVPLVLLCLGVSWFLSSLGVFIRDIDAIVPVLLLILMYASAIFYPISRVPTQFLPLVQYNPLAVLIDQSRNVTMWGMPLDWRQFAFALVVGLAAMIGGYAFFMRTKRAFADVV